MQKEVNAKGRRDGCGLWILGHENFTEKSRFEMSHEVWLYKGGEHALLEKSIN